MAVYLVFHPGMGGQLELFKTGILLYGIVITVVLLNGFPQIAERQPCKGHKIIAEVILGKKGLRYS